MLEKTLNLNKFTQLFFVLFLFLSFIIVSLFHLTSKKPKSKNNFLIGFIRIPFHFYALLGLFTLNIYVQNYYMVIVTIFVMFVDIAVHFYTRKIKTLINFF